MMSKFEKALKAFDVYNQQDPVKEMFEGKEHPKEVLYGHRMSQMLCSVYPDAEESLRLAARCQHIGRWEIPRDTYPKDRVGYLKWRNDLKKHHAGIATRILRDVGYEEDVIQRVCFLLEKKNLKRDEGTQRLEDVICLVFLVYYLKEFSQKHTEEKLIEILKKTWSKMSEEGQQQAMKLKLPGTVHDLLDKAL